PNTRGEFVRACLDSLALTYRKTLDGLEDILGRKIAAIHVVGGGSQNELLNQMTAAACGRPVLAGPVDAPASGMPPVQAAAAGPVAACPPGHGSMSLRLQGKLAFRFMRWRFALKGFDEQTERTLESVLSRVIDGTEQLDKAVVLAFDRVYDDEGRPDDQNTHLY